jgi:hypothetical protein
VQKMMGRAAEFLARRNELLLSLEQIDTAIDQVVSSEDRSQEQANAARKLFERRQWVVDALEEDFDVYAPQHPAVWIQGLVNGTGNG